MLLFPCLLLLNRTCSFSFGIHCYNHHKHTRKGWVQKPTTLQHSPVLPPVAAAAPTRFAWLLLLVFVWVLHNPSPESLRRLGDDASLAQKPRHRLRGLRPHRQPIPAAAAWWAREAVGRQVEGAGSTSAFSRRRREVRQSCAWHALLWNAAQHSAGMRGPAGKVGSAGPRCSLYPLDVEA